MTLAQLIQLGVTLVIMGIAVCLLLHFIFIGNPDWQIIYERKDPEQLVRNLRNLSYLFYIIGIVVGAVCTVIVAMALNSGMIGN